MKKLMVVLIILSAQLYGFSASIGYKGFVIGTTTKAAAWISVVKEFPMNEYMVNEDENYNCIEVSNLEWKNRKVLLYFNEKNILYSIQVWAGEMSLEKFTVLTDQMRAKYGRPFNVVPNVGADGFGLYGWVLGNYRIMAWYETDRHVQGVVISYTDETMSKKYSAIKYKDSLKEY